MAKCLHGNRGILNGGWIYGPVVRSKPVPIMIPVVRVKQGIWKKRVGDANRWSADQASDAPAVAFWVKRSDEKNRHEIAWRLDRLVIDFCFDPKSRPSQMLQFLEIRSQQWMSRFRIWLDPRLDRHQC